MSKAAKNESAAVRRGRGVALLAYSILTTAFVAVCAAQIFQQAWAAGRAPTELDCPAGVRSLIVAVHRARALAAGTSGGEREALSAFRRAVEPEWAARESIGERCSGNAKGQAALEEVDRLRYAEEHALRYEALDVAGLRRGVEAIERDLR